jgi:cobyrinic acid a,c-diamide synthase
MLEGRSIAVARDAAFCFHYPANLECLEALGARLVFFSPLADAALPACDAVWLPGGYPELHGPAIAANAGMRAALATHVEAGKPLLAECGGMMACFETLTTADDATHRMFGLLPGGTRMQTKLAGLGMISAELPEGRLTGHTFHYSTAETPLAPLCRATTATGRPGEAIHRRRRLTASYMHFYFPANPEATARLFLA